MKNTTLGLKIVDQPSFLLARVYGDMAKQPEERNMHDHKHSGVLSLIRGVTAAFSRSKAALLSPPT